MHRLLVKEIYWDFGVKSVMGDIVINVDQIKWVSIRNGYYRVQFAHSLFVDVEDREGRGDMKDYVSDGR